MLNLDIDDFLKNYWQKKPLLIRAVFTDYQSPITAEELAGLACEDFVESKIIKENTLDNFFFGQAGFIPAKPSKRLETDKFEIFINKARKHSDYRILDNALVLLSPYAKYIKQHSDINLFVIRINYSKKDEIH